MQQLLCYLTSRFLLLIEHVEPHTVAFLLTEITRRIPVKHQVIIARGMILFLQQSEVTLDLPLPWLARGLDPKELGDNR